MKRDWIKIEKALMRTYGLRPQPASGSGDIFKEDGESDKLVAQLKSTEGKSISFKKSDFLKLVKHAWESHKRPVFFFNFMSGNESLVLVAVRPFDLSEVAKEFERLKI